MSTIEESHNSQNCGLEEYKNSLGGIFPHFSATSLKIDKCLVHLVTFTLISILVTDYTGMQQGSKIRGAGSTVVGIISPPWLR